MLLLIRFKSHDLFFYYIGHFYILSMIKFLKFSTDFRVIITTESIGNTTN